MYEEFFGMEHTPFGRLTFTEGIPSGSYKKG